MINIPKPTKTELAILNIMWQISPATVRQIHEELIKNGKTSYTTTLKMLQVMHQKGLVSRNSEQKAHIYQPSLSKKETQKQMLDDLKNRLFGGSISSLVLQALGTADITKQSEINEIKAILEKAEEES
ncbi:BlaI/MecI/CopY family transcriptional regulator [Marinicella litoralis]|uniref:Putative transcriptional regulator n=1 Tax=Marinicella litoralis TaxID=644220 RepID=A0A4R6XF35_9GAMM|nr:BlaI/MecI/CopY family transcriptional regulator [Marinicella litoralis]TDR16274.1 putative transcriptional regulator [Marinicella litoralis]